MDESTKQLLAEVRVPQAGRPGAVERYDSEYRRNGVAALFLAFEPLAGWRHVQVTQTRTRKDRAWFIKDFLDERYAPSRIHDGENEIGAATCLMSKSRGDVFLNSGAMEVYPRCLRFRFRARPAKGNWSSSGLDELTTRYNLCDIQQPNP